MIRDYFQEALHTFNGGNWYGWKTHDDNGNKIPNDQRMQYQHNINTLRLLKMVQQYQVRVMLMQRYKN